LPLQPIPVAPVAIQVAPPVLPVLAPPPAAEPFEVDEPYAPPPLSLPAPTQLRPAAAVSEQPVPAQPPLLSAVPAPPAAIPAAEHQHEIAEGAYAAPPLSPPLSG
jgi:hypothetical protein